MFEDKTNSTHTVRTSHMVHMDNRSKMNMTGITDVVSFDLNKVILETDYGTIVIKGSELHVNRLSLEKGELEFSGTINSFEYSGKGGTEGKGESFIGRLFK